MPRDNDLEESLNSIEFYDNCLAIKSWRKQGLEF